METIKSNEEISNLFDRGRRYSNQYASFVVFEPKGKETAKENNEHGLYGRVAFIAGKKHGNAVWRNSAKRRLREIYRSNSEVLEDLDVLFIAKPTIMKASYSKVLNACVETMGKFSHER